MPVRSVLQKVPRKRDESECPTRMSSKSVSQKYQQECPTWVPSKSVPQKYEVRASCEKVQESVTSQTFYKNAG